MVLLFGPNIAFEKKKTAAVPLRRSPRKIKYVSVQKKKAGGCKKGKQKPKKKAPRKTRKSTSWRKKRTRAYHSYWLNGLRLSSKPDVAKWASVV